MHLVDKALQIAVNAHAGQLDKAGRPYILHPLRIMLQMQTDDEKITALLHDVLEDTELSAQDLLDEGIPFRIVDAVQVLTRLEDEHYSVFMTRVRANELAVKVKTADIEDNLNLLRLKTLRPTDWVRILKYHSAWQQLNGKDQGLS